MASWDCLANEYALAILVHGCFLECIVLVAQCDLSIVLMMMSAQRSADAWTNIVAKYRWVT
jgi:membrane protein YqaA with SNARE-associated domain